MIPAEAVAAAASIPGVAILAAEAAVFDAMIEHGPNRHTDGHDKIARAALEAAAPYMQVSTQRPERGWIAKNRNADGSVSIIGHFRNEAEAEKYAEMWPAAIVERAT